MPTLGCHYEKYKKKTKKVNNYKEMIDDMKESKNES
jgi:DNA-directed RNA polymerase subunit N (RpoN/RPB10)